MARDQRQSPRLVFKDTVEVERKGTYWEFATADVSDTGIGLEPVAAKVVAVGELVTVVLPTGDEIAAEVLEASETRVRLRFRPASKGVVEDLQRGPE